MSCCVEGGGKVSFLFYIGISGRRIFFTVESMLGHEEVKMRSFWLSQSAFLINSTLKGCVLFVLFKPASDHIIVRQTGSFCCNRT